MPKITVHKHDHVVTGRSSYGPLANLLNAVGATLAPKVFYGGAECGLFQRRVG